VLLIEHEVHAGDGCHPDRIVVLEVRAPTRPTNPVEIRNGPRVIALLGELKMTGLN